MPFPWDDVRQLAQQVLGALGSGDQARVGHCPKNFLAQPLPRATFFE